MITNDKLIEMSEEVRLNGKSLHWLIGALSVYVNDAEADKIIDTARKFSNA